MIERWFDDNFEWITFWSIIVGALAIMGAIVWAVWYETAHPCVRREPIEPYAVTTCVNVGQTPVCSTQVVSDQCAERR